MVNLSLTALSLFAPSPPKLPNLPTLSDLQKHRSEFQEIILAKTNSGPGATEALSSPSNERTKPPPQGAKSTAIHGTTERGDKEGMAKSWYTWMTTPIPTSRPPSYTPSAPAIAQPIKIHTENELDRAVISGGGDRRVLKKSCGGKERKFHKLQEGIPDGSPSNVAKGRKGKVYAITRVQPSLDEKTDYSKGFDEGKSWRRWFACGA